jgi:hypothetical protein
MGWIGAVQIHEEELGSDSRPKAPADCALCRGGQKLHRLCGYERNADCTGEAKVRVQRFDCPRCRATFGVIPRGMMPYRSLRVDRLERWMDERHGVSPAPAGGDPRPPPASEVERGCLLRAAKCLLQRIPVLSRLLGQQMPRLARTDIGGFWRALRKVGRLGAILVHLAANFKVSVLGNYRSLFANWPRAEAPG